MVVGPWRPRVINRRHNTPGESFDAQLLISGGECRLKVPERGKNGGKDKRHGEGKDLSSEKRARFQRGISMRPPVL